MDGTFDIYENINLNKINLEHNTLKLFCLNKDKLIIWCKNLYCYKEIKKP